MKSFNFLLLAAFQLLWVAAATQSDLPPIVDLGYALYQGTVNTSGSYYNFSNIRFGDPPTGALRFAAPVPPQTVNRTIDDGQTVRNCPQANLEWQLIAEQFLSGGNVSNMSTPAPLNASSLPVPDSQTSEDCLFLDVFVPQKIFSDASCGKDHRQRPKNGAAVLVWIYGGGYVTGTKSYYGSAASLVSRSLDNNGEGIIFVEINYRLGLFGWLPSANQTSGATSNAGLYDQRLALEWVQKYIHLFGGDPHRVTVIGESAGGGSVEHQITAYGGQKGAPFHQAILQSPWLKPTPDIGEQAAVFQKTLAAASTVTGQNITTIDDLRNLTTTELFQTNIAVTGESIYGNSIFGPVVDGVFVPDLPGKLLLEGKFHHSISNVMVAYNSNEGLVFTSPFLSNNSDFVAYVQEELPEASQSTINYITQTLYPDQTPNVTQFASQLHRAAIFNGEFLISCNTRYLDTAFNNNTFAYLFSLYPGTHEVDVAYTFFNGDTSTPDQGPPVNATIATTFQSYLVNFAMHGDPNGNGLPAFPRYGNESLMLNITNAGFDTQVTDPEANARCTWWQQALYS